METNWNESQPIYRQLRDRVVAMILEGVLNDGDPLPSVRSVAAEATSSSSTSNWSRSAAAAACSSATARDAH
jgi:DNA-binding transcriptional regulator YhcF (GntR family)